MNNAFFRRLLATEGGFGQLALRVAVGVIFAAHGSQKLFGWFGGYGLEGTGQFFESVGLHPGELMALLGLFVRPAAVLVGFTMLVAIFSVHASKGFFLDKGGIEYALALFAASVSLAFSGGGKASADRSLSSRI